MLTKMKYEVVYEHDTNFAEGIGPYGYNKVGIKIVNRVFWLAMETYPGSSNGERENFKKWEKEAKFIVDCCNGWEF